MHRSLIFAAALALTMVAGMPLAARTSVGIYYQDEEKYMMAAKLIGDHFVTSRQGVLSGSQSGVAVIARQRIHYYTGAVMVCNRRRIGGVVMVFCARHTKLQRYLRSKELAFVLVLQQFRAFNLTTPLFVDWGW